MKRNTVLAIATATWAILAAEYLLVNGPFLTVGQILGIVLPAWVFVPGRIIGREIE